MKKIGLLILGFAIFHSAFAQPGSVLKGADLPNAGYSVYAIDAESGAVIYETPQVSLVPASVIKLVTTAAALGILGPGFQFHTQIGFNGKINPENGALHGNLVFRGGCDPAFYSEYFPEHYQGTFESWGEAMRKAGIKSINGDLILDLSQLEVASVPGGWLWEDIGNYYGAGVSALSYSDNCYRIHFSSAEQAGKPVVISGLTPAMDSLSLTSNVVSSTANRDLTVVYGAPGSFSQVVEGSIPLGRTDFVVKAATPDPPRTAATEFINVLKKKGIVISGKIRPRDKTENISFELVADKPSPTLQELIIPLNQKSINLFAEHLLREIGRARKGSSSLVKSLEALNEFWESSKIFSAGFYPTDGCGLSRSNAVCPRTLAEVLRFMYLGPNRDVFFNSLPAAGESGSSQSAFKGSNLEHNLQANTGSMTRVRSLAGIFTDGGGRKVIFAVIANNFNCTQAAAGHAFENLLNELYTLKISEEWEIKN